MIFAAVGDTGYNIVLLLHILSAMAAFAPVFIHPVLTKQSTALEGSSRNTMLGFLVQNSRRIHGPGVVLTGVFGFGLQGMSDGHWGFDQGWLMTAVIIWIAMNGVLHGMVFPGERALAEGDESVQKKLDIGGGIITVLLVVMLWLMVFQPGA